MNKNIFAVILASTLLFLVSCSAPAFYQVESTSSHIPSETLVDEVERDLKDVVGEAIPYDYLTVKKTDKDRLNIEVSIYSSSEITYLATYVDTLLNACNQIVDMSIVHEIRLNQCNEEGRIEVIFVTTDTEFGKLIDWRSGEGSQQSIANLDELMEIFPASKIKMREKENLTDLEYAIYSDVLDALEAEPDRTEEDIFEELAPSYDMTSSELKDLVTKLIDKVYE